MIWFYLIVNYCILPKDVCHDLTNLILCIYCLTIRNSKQCKSNKKKGWELRRFIQLADGSIPKPLLKAGRQHQGRVTQQHTRTDLGDRCKTEATYVITQSSWGKAKGEMENTKRDEEIKRWTKDKETDELVIQFISPANVFVKKKKKL